MALHILLKTLTVYVAQLTIFCRLKSHFCEWRILIIIMLAVACSNNTPAGRAFNTNNDTSFSIKGSVAGLNKGIAILTYIIDKDVHADSRQFLQGKTIVKSISAKKRTLKIRLLRKANEFLCTKFIGKINPAFKLYLQIRKRRHL
jgi:hypothetical protein